MNYYRHFAARTLCEGVKNPLMYLISLLYSIMGVLVLRALVQAGLPEQNLEFLRLALVVNGLAFIGYVSVFLYSSRVFFQEKKARTLVMTLCSPASLNEIFWGKVAGVVAGGFLLPVLIMAAVSAVFAPRGLALLLSPDTAAAFVLVLAAETVYAAVSGMLMLSAKDERGIALALYAFGGVQVMLTAIAKATAGQGLFRGILFQYGAFTAGAALLAAAVYFWYFSKLRVVQSA